MRILLTLILILGLSGIFSSCCPKKEVEVTPTEILEEEEGLEIEEGEEMPVETPTEGFEETPGEE
ncbi:TPA: hypothetical protein DCX16_00045 [bacterium]|nr:hypothetical protein [bacterium]